MKNRACVGLFAACLLLPSSAFAQEGVIEEIIVTAQKREQNLQDIPVSVTAFTGKMIEDLGFRQSVDITAQTPNFNVGYPNGDTGVPALYIRGVGLSDYGVLNQGPIASYVDEVYISSNASQIFQLLDVERVEVLRGPQGTLYGRNATGGAVNYVSRKPTAEWGGWGRATVGEWESTKFEGAIGGPLGERMGVRASFLKTDSDGWLKNRFTGNDQQGVDEFAWRVLLEADATDSLNLLFNVHGGKTESDAVQYRHLGTWPEPFWFDVNCPNSAITGGQCVDLVGYTEQAAYDTGNGVAPAVPDFDEGNYNLEAENDTDFWGASLIANWEFGNEMVLTSITAYDDVDDFRPEDTDAGPINYLEGTLAVDQQTFSQEFRLSQQRDRWHWLAGVFYLNDEATDTTSFDIGRDFRPDYVGNNEDCLSAPPGNPTGFCPEVLSWKQSADVDQEIESFSIYADATIDLTDAWSLLVGLRYTDEEVDHSGRYFFDEPVAGNPTISDTNDNTDFDNVSGRFVANWNMNDNVMFYGGVSTGFKGGGIQSTTDGSSPYEEEELLSYEAGFKTTLAEGRIRFNGSVFFYDYSDLQVFTFINAGTPPAPTQFIDNASDAEIYGAEFELQWLPVDNAFINLGLGLLDTEYEDFVDALGNDFSGNTIILAPEVSFNGLAQYDFVLSFGTITAQWDFSYQDEVFFDSINNPLLSEDSYWLQNARIAWTSVDERWEAAVWGRNLNDEEYMVYGFDLSFFGFHEEMLGTPRMFGVELTYRR
jgi:iron complex outermembrane receptor protein